MGTDINAMSNALILHPATVSNARDQPSDPLHCVLFVRDG
jgi:hypothetical protein